MISKLSCFLLVLTLLLTGCSKQEVKDEEKLVKTEIKIEDNVNNENINEKIDNMISNMTLKEKIAQMIILDYSYVSYGEKGEDDITVLQESAKQKLAKYGFGGVILFADNIVGTEQTYKLTSSMQEAVLNNESQNKIPLFIAVDQEGGRVVRLTTGTTMPGNIALGAINDYETTKKVASIIGSEVKSLGFNIDFAPVVDVNNNPSNPIIGVRSFSSDPNRVANMGKAFIEGIQSQKVATSIKHFPGHGDTATDSHTGLPEIDKSYDEIKNFELIPFQAGIDAGTDMIMTAHIVYPQIEKTTYKSISNGEEILLPSTLSKKIITDILRTDMGYDGVVVTDALNMGAISKHFEKMDTAKFAINAGVDILLMPFSIKNTEKDIDAYLDGVVKMVENGEIPESRINESTKRILLLKQKMGLLDNVDSMKYSDDGLKNAMNTVGSKEHHDFELEVCEKAITLVKNNDMLPIKVNEGQKVLVLTAFENEENSAKYALEILKERNLLNKNFSFEIMNYENKDFSSSFIEAVNKADYIIANVDSYNKSYLNPSNEKGWQAKFLDQLIKEAHKQSKKVAIISCYLPYDIARYQEADAIVCCYYDKAIGNLPIEYNGETKTFGQNIVAGIIRLFTEDSFDATLPMTVYKLDKNYEYTNEVLYEVGYKVK